MADVSREAPLGGFRAEASIMGNTSAYDRWSPTVGADTRGECSVTRPYHTDIDGQLSSAGKYMNTET